MRRRGFSILGLISLILLFGALVLAAYQLALFSRVRSYLPAGLTVASVPVGGLDTSQAADRLTRVYNVPVVLHYNDNVVLLNPSTVDFSLSLESMLALATAERAQKQFWQDYWDYLWGRTEFPTSVPIQGSYSKERLRAFLTDVALRYDMPSEAASPVLGSTAFEPARAGSALSIDEAAQLIEFALYSLDDRDVELPLRRVEPGRPVFENLEVMLKQSIQASGFDGLSDIYLLDLQTAKELHFAYRDGEDIPVQPDIAFTASSTIKLPIMVSTYRRLNDESDAETMRLLGEMIEKSGNEVADWLMDRVMEPGRAPLEMTEDLKALGLQNTFMAGYFTFGSPLLAVVETPANQRTDVFTDPDVYSQTTPSELGMLLEDLYQCAQNGGGALMAVFPGEITQAECQSMNNYLLKNRLPVLLTAGLPEATPIAHKHGWVTYNGVINTIGDAGIIYSPGGNYIMVVFLYHPEQLIWESASVLVAQLSQVVYGFYNIQEVAATP